MHLRAIRDDSQAASAAQSEADSRDPRLGEKTMKRLSLVVTLSLCCLTAQTGPVDEHWLYITNPLKWERGYRPGQPAPKLANALILVLDPGGSYYALWCSLFRKADESLTIEYSEGYTLLAGSWRQEHGRIQAHYRILYANVWSSDHSNPDRQLIFDYAPAKERRRIASWLRS